MESPRTSRILSAELPKRSNPTEAPTNPDTKSTWFCGIEVARSAKSATVPMTRTVSKEPANERNTVATDNIPNGTPQAKPRTTGATIPTSNAAMSVVVMDYGVPSAR